jgi:hypothetical protein
MDRKTGRRGLRAPTMEGAVKEAPTTRLLSPLLLAFRLASALPADVMPLPGTSEPHGPKMAAPLLPPLPPDTGSDDIAVSWSSANRRGRRKPPGCCC